MKTEIEACGSIDEIAPEWEALAEREQASPFLRPGWLDAWWGAFGSGELHILAARQNGRLAGVLPLYRSGGVLCSTANPHTPLFGFLAANEEAAGELSRALFSQRARRIELSFLSPSDAPPIRAAARDAGYRVFNESMPAAPYVATGAGWEEYKGGLRKKPLGDLLRRRRRLEEKGSLTLEVADGAKRLDELLEEGFGIESSGWKESYGTSINSEPAARRFYTSVARWAADRGWLRLAFLRFEGRGLAFDYCLEHNEHHYLIKTGYDPDYRKFAPGLIIRYLMISRVFSQDTAVYDMLGLSDDWKLRWASAQQERHFLHMFAPTTLGSLDRAALVYGRSAARRAKSLAHSLLSDRTRESLRRNLSAARAKLGK